MAKFDPPVNPTGDPSYTGNQFTQGTDRASLQPLPSVPSLNTKFYQPDNIVDKTVGKAIEGAGSLFDTAVKATDAAIQNNIDDTIQKGVSGIRDSFLTAQAAAIQQGSPQDVAGGLTLSNAQDTTPVAVNRLGQKIQNLQEAYRQGVFDDTAYYGKLEAYVRQVKAQYPGYAQEVDQKIQKITGVTPANALRSAQQQKLDEINKQSQAANNKQDTYEKQNQAYIQTVWPNYFVDKAKGTAPDFIHVQNEVGKLQAEEWQTKAKSAELALDKSVGDKNKGKAEDLATQGLTGIASQLVLGTTNSMGLKSAQDFNQLYEDIRTGKRQPLTPEEKSQVADSLGLLRGQYLTKAEEYMSAPLAAGSTETLTSKINNPATREAKITEGMKLITNLEDGLFNEKYGLVSHDINWNNATRQAALGSFLKAAPAAAAVDAGRQLIGDNGALMLNLYNGPLADNIMQGFRQFGQGSAAAGTGSMSQTFDIFKREGQNDPELFKKHIQDSVNILVHSKETAQPETVAKNAVSYLFGQNNGTLVEAYASKPGSQVVLFNNLVSKPVVDAISKLDKESQGKFLSWAESGFASVYATQAMGANQNAKAWASSANLRLEFDPQSGNFSYVPTNATRGFFTPAATVQKANSGLQPLNSAINNMKEVFKMQGKAPTDALYNLLPVAGIEPGSPLYKAVQDKVEQDAEDKVQGANPR